MRARWFAVLGLIAPLLVQAPATALSCVPFADQKPYSTFAGTIVQQRGDLKLLVVREVWSGADLTKRTWVRFDDLGFGPAPAIGQAWVVFADDSFRVNSCTATPDDDGVDKVRPDKVREPVQATWWSAIRTRLIFNLMLAPTADVIETG